MFRTVLMLLLLVLGSSASGASAALPGHRRSGSVVFAGPRVPEIALTFDDDFCGSCVHGLLTVLAEQGASATFCPNGRQGGAAWSVADRRLARRLVARGRIGFCNHTWSHVDPRRLSNARLADELTRNERWIEGTFLTRSLPYFRPPYGAYDSRVVGVARQLGYTSVVLWSGTLADSSPRTVPYLVAAIRHWARPGAIILAHGDFPATPRALVRILAVLRARGLRTVTLPVLLGG